MEALRSFVNKHISQETHYLVLIIALIALFFAGKAYYLAVNSELDQMQDTYAAIGIVHHPVKKQK